MSEDARTRPPSDVDSIGAGEDRAEDPVGPVEETRTVFRFPGAERGDGAGETHTELRPFAVGDTTQLAARPTPEEATQFAPGESEDGSRSGPSTGSFSAGGDRRGPRLSPGVVLKGRFVLEEKLGSGGMGGVYRAVDRVKQDARDRSPHVAVKVLNESFAEHPDAFIALQRESSRTQRLSHPNVASVYDFDRDGDVAFMVMELLEGTPLDRRLKRHPEGLPREDALRVIRDMASGLAHAHARELIHSDFKPGNIYLTRSGVAKVFDFGIARAVGRGGEGPVIPRRRASDDGAAADDGSDRTLFDAGRLGALTPAYASREMFEGREPAPQDDVYGLGIVAYQCLTGRHPFDRHKAPVAESRGLVPARPPGLSRRRWRALRRALAFRREDRTPDAQAFLDEFFAGGGSGTGTAVAVAAVLVAVVALGTVALREAPVPGASAPPAPEVPEAWRALETRLQSARADALDQLREGAFSPVWEELLARDLEAWAATAGSRILVEGFADEAAARVALARVHGEARLPMRVETDPATGGARLVAGPFPADAADPGRPWLDALPALGLTPRRVTESDALARARADAFERYAGEVERRLPAARPPEVDPADPEAAARLEAGLVALEDAGQLLARARRRYPAPEGRAQMLEATLVAREEAWQAALERLREALAARPVPAPAPAEADGYARERDERVFPVFAGRCHRPEAVEAVLPAFLALRPDDRTRALAYLTDCATRRVARSPEEVLATRALLLGEVDHAPLAAVQPPDPCSDRAFVGAGRTLSCVDPLASGGTGPAMVVVPSATGGAPFAIGRNEVSVADYGRFCAATGCPEALAADGALPATGLSVDAMAAYARWLSEETGRSYRLPAEPEWRHAATADGAAPDPNRNCRSSVRGVVKGGQLVAVGLGTPNAWGLVNHVGNADELVRAEDGLAAVGGRHGDPLAECTVATRRAADGAGDPATGFRLVRELR